MGEWIEWKGGGRPVKYGSLVDVRHGDGSIYTEVSAGYPGSYAETWAHGCGIGDIVAYRISDKQSREEAYENPMRDEVEMEHGKSALSNQIGGNHYAKLGDYQPWKVLQAWLTEDEFRGYMKGSAIAYLARERDKGGMQDVEKAAHTLDAMVEIMAKAEQED